MFRPTVCARVGVAQTVNRSTPINAALSINRVVLPTSLSKLVSLRAFIPIAVPFVIFLCGATCEIRFALICFILLNLFCAHLYSKTNKING